MFHQVSPLHDIINLISIKQSFLGYKYDIALLVSLITGLYSDWHNAADFNTSPIRMGMAVFLGGGVHFGSLEDIGCHAAHFRHCDCDLR